MLSYGILCKVLVPSLLSASSSDFFLGGEGPHCIACGILDPLRSIETGPHVVETQRSNHWTTREVPKSPLLMRVSIMLDQSLP